jgi:suppressor of G2 allele of SKP1
MLQVLQIDEDNFEAHLQLARLHNKLNNFVDAAAEGARAVELRPKSDAAYFEQAKALHALEEYESAKEAFEMASVLEPNKKVYKNWIGMCQVAMGEELTPEVNNPENDQTANIPTTDKQNLTRITVDEPEYAKYWNTMKIPAPVVDPELQLYRHQWFQSHSKVEINILAKNIEKDRVNVDIGATKLSVSIVDENDREIYGLSVDPLFASVDPATSRHAVLKTKIEIVLVKATPGETWSSLEEARDKQFEKVPLAGNQEPSTSTMPSQPTPAYPYAGKRIDWNKVESELKKEEKEEALDGDAVSEFIIFFFFGIGIMYWRVGKKTLGCH